MNQYAEHIKIKLISKQIEQFIHKKICKTEAPHTPYSVCTVLSSRTQVRSSFGLHDDNGKSKYIYIYFIFDLWQMK